VGQNHSRSPKGSSEEGLQSKCVRIEESKPFQFKKEGGKEALTAKGREIVCGETILPARQGRGSKKQFKKETTDH